MVRTNVVFWCFSSIFWACGGEADDAKDHPQQTHEDESDDGGDSGDDSDDSGTGNGDDGGSGSGSGTGGDSGQAAVFPQEGTWSITSATTEIDTCQCDDLDDGTGGGDATFTLEALSDTVFAMSVDGGDALACTLNDAAFVCETADAATPVDDFDITIHTSTVISGMVPNDTKMVGSFDIGVSCTGSDCGWVSWVCDEDLPCQIVSSFEASAD